MHGWAAVPWHTLPNLPARTGTTQKDVSKLPCHKLTQHVLILAFIASSTKTGNVTPPKRGRLTKHHMHYIFRRQIKYTLPQPYAHAPDLYPMPMHLQSGMSSQFIGCHGVYCVRCCRSWIGLQHHTAAPTHQSHLHCRLEHTYIHICGCVCRGQ